MKETRVELDPIPQHVINLIEAEKGTRQRIGKVWQKSDSLHGYPRTFYVAEILTDLEVGAYGSGSFVTNCATVAIYPNR